MKHNKLTSIVALAALSLLTIVSCTSEPKSETKEEAPATEEAQTPAHPDTVEITLNSNDLMQYDKAELNVFAGQTVVFTLHHTGKMKVTEMGHNFVLLENGISVDEFSTKALEAKDNGYIPADGAGIIAHTNLIGGGESATITFKAPEQGNYDYLCSFPGHHAMMKGILNVK